MGRTVVTALMALIILGGCASAPPNEAPLPGKFADALRRAPQGMVALIVEYCKNQRSLPARRQIVATGQEAVFERTQAVHYVLKAKPLKLPGGKLVTLLDANWVDGKGTYGRYTGHLLTQEGEKSPETVLRLDGYESCFTVTAQSSPHL
ncbi:hypothetical protein RBE51_19465 [Pseudomonas taiwanensis]|uniref:hypothetical protein n=1 Tax=Pseudomonas taiwanensis TaxID=470150 RepID=UPI0028DDED5F|nr:hypothetical protein [Pseudomonas taiwanensis]MDT8924970.1 hypothetical protein [Pseudomonas taiwanensis]